jgi:O-antigen ligase
VSSIARPVPLPESPPGFHRLRDLALAAFFVALGFSISCSQSLLALLVVLVVPWFATDHAAAGVARLRTLGGAVWADTASLRRHPLTPPFLAFIGLSLLSAVFSGDPGWSLWVARDTLRIATFYLVLWYTRDSAHALRLWTGFLVVLTIMAVYGLTQVYLCGASPVSLPATIAGKVCTHSSRVSGPFSIYMTFGGVLLLGAIFFASYLANVPWRRAWWMVPAGAVTVAALAFTHSRNAWLGLAAGTVGLVLTARRPSRMLVVVIGGALALGLLTSGTVRERVRSMANPHDETIRDRVAMWRSGLAMIADHPVLGVGPGQVRAWYPHYRRPEAVRPSTGHLHNSPVQVAAERGLPALAVWLWLWVVFFREAGAVMGRVGRDRPRERALVCASLWGVGGFLVAGLFEHNFGDAEVVMVVYALMAIPWIVARDLPAARPAAA